MSKQFDVIVLGTGSAGSTVAHTCKKAGMSVAIIDSRPFGGTCALRGCVPKKVYTAASEAVDWADRLNDKGIDKNNLRINWGDLQEFKRTFTEPFPENREQGYTDAGIDTYHGRAEYADDHTVHVGDTTLRGEHIVIATGAKPRPLGIPGEQYLTSSTDFLNLEQLPDDIVFIGAGFISMEFAHVAVRAGASVRIIHRSARPLKPFDPDLVDILVDASRDAGIEFSFNAELTAVDHSNDAYMVHATKDGEELTFETDMVVHGAGRVAEIDDLNLENVSVDAPSRGVKVNEYLQSETHPHIYAGGDAADSGPPLTPVASLDGEVIADNIINGASRTPDYRVVPSVVFSEPHLTTVGLSEQQARDQGRDFRVSFSDTGNWVTSRRINQPYSGFKILIEKETDLILGAHLLGPHAEEVINIFALAIKEDIPASTLKEMIYAYPTSASDISYML
ncbi:MAG: NAD(P)/FAD-dependent oxidoreductase [Candidatus Marinimicrobia bacterium]|nr:NAD(P)/FAD-dependent oxidoreductase [Candidatus Neomarinimicrobiota bacterium]MCF7829419.1 NAD(P)/FAD-dependent oxidoreductase [Candidatus Neomarinimicrobiota bacterium]MCF7880905.1 NAD(P)/FAD-dependent oxidoreductase [Candidatus Neomarinimicrobiota bacterium]